MARHRNIKGMDLTDEMDDSYGSSYGTSLDSEPCVSPSTKERYTFNRSGGNHSSRLSDHFQRSRQDSVVEEDEIVNIDDENARLEASGSCEDDGLLFRSDSIGNQPTTSTNRAIGHQQPEKSKCGSVISGHSNRGQENELKLIQESLKSMVVNDDTTGDLTLDTCGPPLLPLNQLCHERHSLLDVFESKYQNRRETKLYKPLLQQLSEYHKSQDYWFDFSTIPIRFPLSAKVKGKLPTPINEIDSDSLPSKVGQRLNLGPNLTNVIPEVRTKQASDSVPVTTDNNNTASGFQATLKVSGVNPFRNVSPAGSREGSRRSSPAPNKNREKSSVNLEALLNEYTQRESNSKPLINLVIIGHVDAGKSTLMGRLLCDLGEVSQKQMHRNETDSKKTGKSSFLYAWVLDETEEERSRGITMDVASARFETKNRKIQILDAPGHKDFIPNMITGAAAADTALLVIDATKGEFEAGFESGGQTREHTMLVRSLGVSTIAVVINKLDNVQWSQERYNEIVSKLRLFLKQTGFKDSDVTFVPTSGLRGENLIKSSSDPNLASWYNGPCLLDVIDSIKPPERVINKPFRLSIGDIFKGLISGVSISGRIDAGAVSVGSKLVVMPSAEPCTVKAITIDEESVNQTFAGDNVILVLSGLDPVKVSIGSIICDPTNLCPVTSKFEARVVIFNSIEIPIIKGLPIAIHYNNSSEQGTIKRIICSINKSTGKILEEKNVRFLTKNSSGLIIIETIRPICIELYKDYKDLGRFMIRVSGNTIAAGLVTNIL